VWQRLTVSRAREQRSQLTAAKFRVLTGSLKSLLDQGLVDALLSALTTQSRVHTVPIFSVKAVQMAAVEQDWIVPRKGNYSPTRDHARANYPWRDRSYAFREELTSRISIRHVDETCVGVCIEHAQVLNWGWSTLSTQA
jgi:hypothetical protein